MPRREPAHDAVLPVVSPAADDVVALVDLLEEERDVGRVVLESPSIGTMTAPRA